MPGRRHQHREVVHATSQHRADHDPQKAGRKAELRRQRGANQGTGSGNGGKVVAKEHHLG
jgi:hypothetical protein